ncbi:MAG TPA: tellurite resistance TerB family protein [Polyangiaceae bacterium]
MKQKFSVREVNEAKLEALIETMYLAAHADDEFTDDERAHFVSSVESLTERRLEGDKLEELLQRFQKDYRERGRKPRLVAIRARLGDENSCKLALAMAIRMIAADGVIRTSERDFIMEMAETLGIDRDVAADLMKEIAG